MQNPPSDPQTFLVDLQPTGRRVQVPSGTTLLAAAQAAGVGLVSICGGEGWCEGCRVRVETGECSPPTQDEQLVFDEHWLKQGYRLACQARLFSDIKLEIPPESLTAPQRLQLEGQPASVEIGADESNPNVALVDVQIPVPSLSDLRSDQARVLDTLAENGFPGSRLDFPLLESLSGTLRRQDWRARLPVLDGEVLAALPTGAKTCGLAVDIGTTKLAAYLVDLANGETLAKTGAMNPQIAFGEDIISRIAHARTGSDRQRLLQSRLVETLNGMLAELCAAARAQPEQVVYAVVVGNTAMHHLFAGLPVEQLALAPYVPAVSTALELHAATLGLDMARGGKVQLLPNIAGYVGADHVAVILSTGIWKDSRTVMAIDIGTNTEISLMSGGQLVSCSCASGPAFEGAHIHDGMRAAPGAIERVQITDEQVFTFTIEQQGPVGICGSGILDTVAELRRAGIINEKGAFQRQHPNLRPADHGPEFVLVPAAASGHGHDITISRRDINEIQLAKAAIRTGIEILLETAGIAAEEIEEVLVAGAFGTYIDLGSAIRVGMLPELPLERYHQVGNAAGMGARQALVSQRYLVYAAEIARRAQYIELTLHPRFQEIFLRSMFL